MSAPKKRLLTAGRKESLKGYLLIAPAILLLSVFTIYPIFYLLHSSLHDGSLLSKKRNFVGPPSLAAWISTPPCATPSSTAWGWWRC